MTTTRIHVHNTVDQVTSNQVLMFLQPVNASLDYLYSAWNVLNPAPGSSQSVDLSTSFSGSIAIFGDHRGDYTDPVALPLGKELTITNQNNQSPVITNTVYKSLDPSQVGVYNETAAPTSDFSVVWYVNGKKVVETNNTANSTLNPGFNAVFQLKQSVYLMFGQKPTITTTYIAQTFGTMVEIPVPNGATDLFIKAYTDDKGVDTFMAVSPAEYALLERSAHLRHQQRRTAATLRASAPAAGDPGGGDGNPVTHTLSSISVLSLYRDSLLNHNGRGQAVFIDGTIIELRCGDFGTNLPVVGEEYSISGHDDTLGIDFSYILLCTRAGRISAFVRRVG